MVRFLATFIFINSSVKERGETMRKSRIGKKIYDVVTPEEYIEADKANPEASQNLMDDTAIMDNGYVYPLNKQYSKNNPGVTD